MNRNHLWAAVLCVMLCLAGMLAGCKGSDELLHGVEKADLLTSPVSSFISHVDETARLGEVLDYFSDAEFVQVAEAEKEEYLDGIDSDEELNLLKALCIVAYGTDIEPISLYVYPSGSVRVWQGDAIYYAEAGSVRYEGLLAVFERIEDEERAAMRQGEAA